MAETNENKNTLYGGAEASRSEISATASGGLEFNFDSGIPKTRLVFEETDDAEAPEVEEQPVSQASEESAAEPAEASASDESEPSASEPEGESKAQASVPVAERTVDDEEFIIPDTFVVSEEFNTPLGDYVSTIWKTYVPRFTEVTENHNYFADNSLLKAKKPETSPVSAPAEERVPEPEAPRSTVTVTVEHRDATAETRKDDPTAEIDSETKAAVVVTVGAKPSGNNDTINVFKFPEERRRREEEAESEEESCRRDIANLTGHKWTSDGDGSAEPTKAPDEEAVRAAIASYTTDSWSDTTPDGERMTEVLSADDERSESDTPKGVSSSKASISDTSEYNSFAMRDTFKDRFLDTIMSVRLRLIIAAILSAITLVFENIYLFGVDLFGRTGISAAAIDACLIAAIFLITLPETARGVKLFMRGILSPELSALVSAISIFAYTLTMALAAPSGVAYSLFGFVYAIFATNSVYSSYCLYSADFAAFRLISEKGVKHIYDTRLTRELERENMALDGAIDEYKSKIARGFDTSFISDFFKTSSGRSENTKNNALILAVAFGVALVAGAVMFFVGDSGIVSGFSTFALVMALATPAFSVISHKLPFAHAEQEALDNRGALIGERTVYDFAGVDVVAFEDTEVFGTDDVSFKSISLSDRRGDFNEAMRKMSSLFAALGGPLAEVFAASLNKKYPAAEDIIIEDDGAEGTIDGKRVMAGNVEYMQRHGIKIPLRNESSVGSTRIMYAAEDGELFAKFTVNYAFSEEFALMLSSMRAKGIVPLVYTRDFNISNEFLHFLTSGADVIRVMRRYTPEVPGTVYGKISAGFVTLGDKTGAVSMLLLARKYASFQSRIALTELLASAVGATLAVVIALCNMTAALPSVLLGAWQIVWSAVLAILSSRTFKKQDKR